MFLSLSYKIDFDWYNSSLYYLKLLLRAKNHSWDSPNGALKRFFFTHNFYLCSSKIPMAWQKEEQLFQVLQSVSIASTVNIKLLWSMERAVPVVFRGSFGLIQGRSTKIFLTDRAVSELLKGQGAERWWKPSQNEGTGCFWTRECHMACFYQFIHILS